MQIKQLLKDLDGDFLKVISRLLLAIIILVFLFFSAFILNYRELIPLHQGISLWISRVLNPR